VRSGEGPALLIAETFRMGGHATHDENEARQILDIDLFSYWGRRDPIGCYEAYLIESGKSDQATLEAIEERVIDEVDQAAEEALASKSNNQPRPESAIEDVYAPPAKTVLV